MQLITTITVAEQKLLNAGPKAQRTRTGKEETSGNNINFLIRNM